MKLGLMLMEVYENVSMFAPFILTVLPIRFLLNTSYSIYYCKFSQVSVSEVNEALFFWLAQLLLIVIAMILLLVMSITGVQKFVSLVTKVKYFRDIYYKMLSESAQTSLLLDICGVHPKLLSDGPLEKTYGTVYSLSFKIKP